MLGVYISVFSFIAPVAALELRCGSSPKGLSDRIAWKVRTRTIPTYFTCVVGQNDVPKGKVSAIWAINLLLGIWNYCDLKIANSSDLESTREKDGLSRKASD